MKILSMYVYMQAYMLCMYVSDSIGQSVLINPANSLIWMRERERERERERGGVILQLSHNR